VDADRRFARDPDFVFRRIAEEVILLPIRQNMGTMESVYALNAVAARVWELLDGRSTLGEIRERIVAEFEVAADTAGADLEELLRELQAIGAVRGGAP